MKRKGKYKDFFVACRKKKKKMKKTREGVATNQANAEINY